MHVHRRARPWFAWLFAALCAAACGRTPDPTEVPPGGTAKVNCTERLGWLQPADSATELNTFRYAVYVDGVRSELGGAGCTAVPFSSSFQCSAPLPPMSDGNHTLELVAFIVDGAVLESERSAALLINKIGGATAPGSTPATPPWPGSMIVRTVDGLRLRLDRVAENVLDPVDMAFVPDGRLFIAEEGGRVRVHSSDGRLAADPALSLDQRDSGVRIAGLAVDQRFDQTPFVYVLYSAASSDGARAFSLARFREASNALFGEVVLLDGIPASARAAGSLRVGADGKLFVALDDGGDAQRMDDLSSPNGKILRLNTDGTTPDDQPGFNPLYASRVRSPHGFEWQPGSNVLWLADQLSENAAALGALGPTRGGRAVQLASYALPRGTMPSSLVFYRHALIPELQDNLLVASDRGQHLLRVRFDATERTRVTSTERLLRNSIGGIRAIAINPAGTIYLATSNAVATLAPAGQ
jgi:glucose/arabinose dehydrogenase